MVLHLLPSELLLIIMLHLQAPSLAALSNTCRSLNNNPFLTDAIDAQTAANAHHISLYATSSTYPATSYVRTRRPWMLRIPALARRGYHRALKIALDHGESPNVVDGYGYSALERAVRSGSLEAVRLLLEAGANLCGLTAYDDRFTLARVARLTRNMEMEELLVKFKTRKSPRGVEE